MNLGFLGEIHFNMQFLSALISIVIIDLVLAGDNAVVIAMAVKKLTGRQRTLGIAAGAGGAVLVRVVCTFFVAKLLMISFIKLLGGAVILWIAVKLLVEGAEDENVREAGNLWQAVWIIVVADMSMGIDNMLAVGGASHGNFFLLIFGLALSIPFVVFMSSLLARLMDRYPIILYIGSGILGKVGGEMMITDPVVHNWLHPPKALEYAVMAFFTIGVIALGRWILLRRKQPAEAMLPAMDMAKAPAVSISGEQQG
ncbi:membrane protein [Desulfosarcina widdelii]|uniref:Membrane protein n=1 Tax=Desulfosarcina widdelii TaxID=947919 RepID=A0A5K7Z9Q4_9BACT|nr:TerC family protein [Desulfosarcina widdelii]BBO76573.1 membrane protein [Desulfosarcina widdelii]